MLPATRVHDTTISPGLIAGLATLAFLGALLVQYPRVAVAVTLGIASLVLMWRLWPVDLDLWKAMVLAAVGSYIVLNYGFENLAFHVGPLPIIVGDTLMLGACALVFVQYRKNVLKGAVQEPAFICLLILLALAVAHLLLDVGRFGLYAIRDASLYIESIFFFLGLVWARNKDNNSLLLRWFVLVFLINTCYDALFPFSGTLKSLSPSSGVFQTVPIIGSYDDSPLYLVAGSLFFLWLGRRASGLSRGLLWFFSAVQFCELGILQTRSAYLGLGLILVLLFVLGEVRKATQVLGVVLASLLGLAILIEGTSLIGVTIPGRVGPVDMSFITEHVSTIFTVGDHSARWDTDEDRLDWYSQVWQGLTASPSNIVWGSGFGEPLIEFPSYRGRASGIVVRQPHNTSLSVVARLGCIGLTVWLFFHFFVLRGFYRAWRARSTLDCTSIDLILWLFFLYLLIMITTSVQPLIEFSHGAVPFFFLTGAALGMIRWQVLEPSAHAQTFNSSVANALSPTWKS